MPAEIDFSYMRTLCLATCETCQAQYQSTRESEEKHLHRCPRCQVTSTNLRMAPFLPIWVELSSPFVAQEI